MILTIERNAALNAINLVLGAVARSGAVPILAHVLLEADTDLSITGTDLILTATTKAQCFVMEKGEITIPAAYFSDILRSLPDGADLEISREEAVGAPVMIRSGRSKFNVPTLPAEDYPRLDADTVACEFKVPAVALSQILTDSVFSAEVNNVKVRFVSVWLHIVNEGDATFLRSISAATRGLAYSQIPAPDEALTMEGALVSTGSVTRIQALLGTAKAPEAMVTITRTSRRIIFTVGETRITTTLVDGGFVDYERLLPTSFIHTITADMDLLEGALTRAMVMTASEKYRILRITVKDGSMSMTGRNQQSGLSFDEIEVDAEGGDVAFVLQGPQFVETIGHIKTESVVLRIAEKGRMTLSPTGESNSFFMVMLNADAQA